MTDLVQTDLMQLIQEADLALVAMEQSRQMVEAAKAALEIAKTEADEAKSSFDQIIAKADEFGVPRVKLRKLTEERAAALMASGLISTPVNQARPPKPARAAKRSKVEKLDEKPDKKADEFSETDHLLSDEVPAEEGRLLRMDA